MNSGPENIELWHCSRVRWYKVQDPFQYEPVADPTIDVEIREKKCFVIRVVVLYENALDNWQYCKVSQKPTLLNFQNYSFNADQGRRTGKMVGLNPCPSKNSLI